MYFLVLILIQESQTSKNFIILRVRYDTFKKEM